MKATFNHSVDVLIKAFLNNTLQHGDCHACAVGNLIADACGIKYYKNFVGEQKWDRLSPSWQVVFATNMNTNKQDIDERFYLLNPNAKYQIDSTGYSWRELARIEYAFETADRGNSYSDYMFNGLMDVVDVLAEIHGIDMSVKNDAKKLFVKVV